MQMKVGILGSGDVGKALAKGFAKYGYDVMVGTRTPEKLAEFIQSQNGKVKTGSFESTAKHGEILVISTLGTATDDVIKLANSQNFAGKVVIDTTNPLDFSGGMPPKLFVGFNDSLGERVQRWLPQARVVKAFNTAGNAFMVNPDFPNGPPTMFIAGNDKGAKEKVSGILKQFGWDIADLGGIENARVLEPMCIGWVNYGVTNNAWNHAYKLLRK